MNNQEVARKVFDEIVAALDDCGKWDNGRVQAFFPNNPKSNRAYKGINILTLAAATIRHGWESPTFMTYKQAQECGGNVRKGERSQIVIFWKMLKVKDKQDPDKDKVIPMLKYYRVFNVQQIDGLPEEYTRVETGASDKIQEAQEIVDGYLDREGIDVEDTFGTPHYAPLTDTIGMPPLSGFKTSRRYYETMFHEIVHSTGHDSRLKRQFGNRFGSGEYAREELIAEFGAAMLTAKTGSVDGYKNLAAYIKNWHTVIKNDPRDLVVAAGRAEKAVDFVENGKADSVPEDAAA